MSSRAAWARPPSSSLPIGICQKKEEDKRKKREKRPPSHPIVMCKKKKEKRPPSSHPIGICPLTAKISPADSRGAPGWGSYSYSPIHPAAAGRALGSQAVAAVFSGRLISEVYSFCGGLPGGVWLRHRPDFVSQLSSSW